MADINFDCPHCNQNLDAFPDMAGETIECPACGEAISIPSLQAPSRVKGKKVVIKKRAPSSSKIQSSRTRPKPTSPSPAPAEDTSEKSRLVALLLCWFLGVLGIHRFYVGKVGTGIAQIFTFGGLGIWVLVDFIMIIAGAFSDKKGLPVKNW